MWWVFPLILLIISISIILFISLRKIAQVQTIDLSTLPKEKARQIKEMLFMERFQRIFGKRIQEKLPIGSLSKKTSNWLSKKGRRFVQYLYRLEQNYQKEQEEQLGSEVKKDSEWIRKLFAEAESFEKQEEYFQAEKRYIEVISRHPKYAKAYEALGNLYLSEKKYDQAKESLRFALKLEPSDASVLVSLGEISLQETKPDEAFGYFEQAIEQRPHNPKYLDYFIESAILAGKKSQAISGVAQLREVNPENQKLTWFEQRIAEQIK